MKKIGVEHRKGRGLLYISVMLGTLGLIFVGFMVFSSICPCAVTPGGLLFGEVIEEPI